MESDSDDEEELLDASDEKKFKCARLGDNFMSSFQCDLCHFRNMFHRDPNSHYVGDYKILVAIRRANLDAFWSRAPSTVGNNFRGLKRTIQIGSHELGIPAMLPEMGPFPLEDNWGMRMAIVTLVRSLDKGRYKDTIQFETARKLRSSFANCWNSSEHALTIGVMAKDRAKTFVTECPTYSLWFEKFIQGLHSRMGDDRRPNAAISPRLMKCLLERIDLDYLETDHPGEKKFYSRAGLFFTAAYLGSFRGEEVPKLLRKHFIEINKESLKCQEGKHVVLPLYGNFKGEGNIPRCYLKRVCCVTNSGLDIERWVIRSSYWERNGKSKFLFSHPNGNREKGSTYENYLFSKLERIQVEEDGLIGKKLVVRDAYGISRSFRRGSTTAASNAPNCDCNEDDINRNNRWRKDDRAGTRHPDLNMLQLYTDTIQSVQAELKFSKCL